MELDLDNLYVLDCLDNRWLGLPCHPISKLPDFQTLLLVPAGAGRILRQSDPNPTPLFRYPGITYRKGQHSCTSCVFSLSLSLRPHAGLGTRRWRRFVIGRLCCYPPSDFSTLFCSACIPWLLVFLMPQAFLSVRAPLMLFERRSRSNHGQWERTWDLENVHQDSCGDGWLERQAAEWHRCWALSFDLLKHDNDQNWSPCPLLNVDSARFGLVGTYTPGPVWCHFKQVFHTSKITWFKFLNSAHFSVVLSWWSILMQLITGFGALAAIHPWWYGWQVHNGHSHCPCVYI